MSDDAADSAKDTSPDHLAQATRLVVAGRSTDDQSGFVNPPVVRASTVLYPDAEALLAHRGRYHYGRHGTPTSEALERALAEIEGERCAAVSLLPSGLAAISTALLSVVSQGDRILVGDSVYRPTRTFCDAVLTRLGVETVYYDPLIGDAIDGLFDQRTRAVFVEAPGSLTFEMPDVPAIAAVARRPGASVIMDNTWATPLLFRALDHGVDLSVQALTKYVGGHSDLMLGAVAANASHATRLRALVRAMGLCAGPDDVWLALRGLRTLGVRLARHQASALEVARWLQSRPEVDRVLHPALPGDPGHAIWSRDFSGACGLFSMVLRPVPERAMRAFLDALQLFGMGYSWGGFESLAIPFDCTAFRTATRWTPAGPAIRLHIGLEDVGDLTADLERGFRALAHAVEDDPAAGR